MREYKLNSFSSRVIALYDIVANYLQRGSLEFAVSYPECTRTKFMLGK